MHRRHSAIVLAALVLAACSGPKDPLAVEAVSRRLPTLAGDTLGGGRFGPADHAGGLLVVNFWATWCGPCQRELPALVKTYDGYHPRGVEFVGVDERDNAAEARDWVRKYGISYPIIEDPSGKYSAAFGFFGLPATYVVDRSGRIRFVIPRETTERELSGLIDRLLAGAG